MSDGLSDSPKSFDVLPRIEPPAYDNLAFSCTSPRGPPTRDDEVNISRRRFAGNYLAEDLSCPSPPEYLSQELDDHVAGRQLGRRERLVKYGSIRSPGCSHLVIRSPHNDHVYSPKVTISVLTVRQQTVGIYVLSRFKDMAEVSKELLSNGRAPSISNEKSPDSNHPPERETWGKKLDFLLSVVGFAVDLGNVWRFPYICYRNGGGAFLIPYLVMLVFAGLPLFYMELALGQYQRCGMIGVWRNICPMFCGIGYGICFISIFVGIYYNTVIAWAMYYTFSCFRSEVPWARCDNWWNTENCLTVFDQMNISAANRSNTSVSSAEEFYVRGVLEMQHSSGIEDVGTVKWSLALCLLAVFIIIYFSLWKGIKSSGKAVWITATLPYIILFILLVRGCTLPGAADGILYYVRPQWHRLLNVEVWIDAAAQIFFSLGPGFGTLLALSSYNKFNNNCYMDALITASINCFTSFIAGFVVFSVLGYMAHIQHQTVENVAIDGPGLVFVVYPEALATLDGSVVWSILFFLMLITLGLDSSFGGLEAVITGVCDEFPRIAKHRKIFVGVLVAVCFICGLATTTYGGQYVITLLDKHGAPIAILLMCFFESIAVSWFYGVNRFSADLKRMLGFEPGIFWKICWAGICPIFLFILFVLSCWAYSGMQLNSYIYPDWSVGLGWMITATSIACVPAYAIYRIIKAQGTIKQRLHCVIRPERDGPTFESVPVNSNHSPIDDTASVV